MNEKPTLIMVFALLGCVAFPLAVYTHFYLYADGAYFFTGLFEHNNFWEGLANFPLLPDPSPIS